MASQASRAPSVLLVALPMPAAVPASTAALLFRNAVALFFRGPSSETQVRRRRGLQASL